MILRNEIPGNNDFFKVTSTKKIGYQIKKSSVSKISESCSNNNLETQTFHNPWHIQNPRIFKCSTVFRSLSDIL